MRMEMRISIALLCERLRRHMELPRVAFTVRHSHDAAAVAHVRNPNLPGEAKILSTVQRPLLRVQEQKAHGRTSDFSAMSDEQKQHEMNANKKRK